MFLIIEEPHNTYWLCQNKRMVHIALNKYKLKGKLGWVTLPLMGFSFFTLFPQK